MLKNNNTTCKQVNAGQISFRKQNCETDCWQPLDSEWRTTAGAWLVAHDLYHHQPGDQGSLAEELATLGAEYYINHECDIVVTAQDPAVLPPPGLNALSRSAAGVVGIALESDTLGAEDLVLSPAEPTTIANPIAERVFQSAAESAIAEMEYIAPDPDFPEWAAVRKAFSLEVVAGWIRAGYRQAQQRFPDQSRVRHAFDAAFKQVKQLSATTEIEAIMTVSLTGYDAHLIVESN